MLTETVAGDAERPSAQKVLTRLVVSDLSKSVP